jgi:hypothetical protein
MNSIINSMEKLAVKNEQPKGEINVNNIEVILDDVKNEDNAEVEEEKTDAKVDDTTRFMDYIHNASNTMDTLIETAKAIELMSADTNKEHDANELNVILFNQFCSQRDVLKEFVGKIEFMRNIVNSTLAYKVSHLGTMSQGFLRLANAGEEKPAPIPAPGPAVQSPTTSWANMSIGSQPAAIPRAAARAPIPRAPASQPAASVLIRNVKYAVTMPDDDHSKRYQYRICPNSSCKERACPSFHYQPFHNRTDSIRRINLGHASSLHIIAGMLCPDDYPIQYMADHWSHGGKPTSYYRFNQRKLLVVEIRMIMELIQTGGEEAIRRITEE